jgi:HPt (histidine-containing phosphotransfer) domain-containing protein
MKWEDAVEGVGGSEDTLRELIGLFFEEAPRLLQQMTAAADEGDSVGLRRAAHTLKGSARLFAAHATADAAFAVETLANEGRLDEATEAITTLQTEVDGLFAYLRDRLGA